MGSWQPGSRLWWGDHAISFSLLRGFSVLKNSSQDSAQNIIRALEEELKVLNFAYLTRLFGLI